MATAQTTGGPRCVKVGWTPLASSGQRFGGETWGALKSLSGKGLLAVVPASSPLPGASPAALAIASPALAKSFKAPSGFKLTGVVSTAPDFPSFHSVGGKAYAINHFENPQPASMYISELASNFNGTIRIVRTAPVPDAKVQGLWHLRSGSVTPWGTHLGAEEYPPDCRSYDEFFVPCKAGRDAAKTTCGLGKSEMDASSITQFAGYYGYYANVAKHGLAELDILNNQKAHDAFVALFKCYNYGGSPEVRVLAGGQTQLTKWRTLGRISHENSIVMPDNRTVYSTDDHPNGAFLKFVADRPKDLSSGTLYAIKLSKQRADANGRPVWDVSWVELGKGNQAELDKLALSGLKFSDIFQLAEPTGSPPKCPSGFSPTNHPSLIYQHTDKVTYATYHMECLKVKPGMRTAAAFFEPRRLASMLGATTEFEKQDGLTWSDRFKQVYFSDARIAKGMTDDKQFNYASSNDISLKENNCGGIFAIDLDDKWSGTSAKLLLGGERLSNTNPGEEKCNPNNVADPEKTEYVAGNLIIQESSPARPESVMWAYNLEDGSLTKIFTAPKGTELTGVGAQRVGDKAFLTFTIQRPFNDRMAATTAAGLATSTGQMGYIGPLPADILSDKFTVKFQAAVNPAGGGSRNVASVTAEACIAPAQKALENPSG